METKRILPLSVKEGALKLEGFIGRPEISRTSRAFETFFVNGRMLRSDILSKALEEGYRTDLMQHRFPFAVLHLTMPAELTDVNVHPSRERTNGNLFVAFEARVSDNTSAQRLLSLL